MDVSYKGEECILKILFKEAKKKKISQTATKFLYDLINGRSILSDFAYQDYIEIDFRERQLNRMITYMEHIMEWRD